MAIYLGVNFWDDSHEPENHIVTPAACEAALDEADEIFGLLASNKENQITPSAILAFYNWKDSCLGR